MRISKGFIRRVGITIVAVAMLVAGCAAGSGTEDVDLVVVAGATGGTGRAVVRNLVAQGYQVRAFVRDEAKARVVLGDEVGYATGDVRDIASILTRSFDQAG
jgi:NADP-dependent 3-hydroxy acid dehydrogenase YdfG